MLEVITLLSIFIKRHPIYSFLLGAVFAEVFLDALSDLLTQLLGIYVVLLILVTGFSILVIMAIIQIWDLKNKREKLRDAPLEPLDKKYKGLIVSISKITEEKKELIDKIGEIGSLDNLNTAKLEELYRVIGIGQTLRAIVYHLKELEVCWLLFTEASKEGKDVVTFFIEKISSGLVNVVPTHIDNPYVMNDTYKRVNVIYEKGLEEFNLQEKDVIADITGGTAPMSSGIILACISSDRNIQYVETDTVNKVPHI